MLFRSEGLITELLDRSGIRKRVERIQPLFETPLSQRLDRLTPKQQETIHTITARAFQSGVLYRSVVATFLRKLDQEKLSQVVAWLKMPLTEKMIRFEQAPLISDQANAMEAFVRDLDRHPPSAERTALIRRLSQATHAEEELYQTSEAAVQGMGKIVSAS